MSHTIIVADDEASVALLLQDTLTQAGYQVVTVAHGGACLAAIKAHTPHLIILDLDMPIMGGHEVLRALRRNRATRKLPVIILTGQVSFPNMQEAWKNGAERYLQKPVSRDTLVATVQDLLSPVQEPAR